MRLIKYSKWQLFMSLIRFVIIRIFYFNKLKSYGLSLVSKKTNVFITGSLILGKKAQIDEFVEIQSRGNLIIGDNLTINKYSRIVCFDNITIGNNCVIAQFVSILDHDHNFTIEGENLKLREYTTAPIKIGNNVWLADKVTILKGVSIGNNVIIGANSVVTNSIPSNSIAAGIPCKVLKSI